jgi:hypothetical protein
MPTNRTPIARRLTPQITAVALDAFRRLVALESECIGPPGCEPFRRCAPCDEWWTQQGIIHRELGLRPWEMAVEYPGMGEWEPDEAACARWRAFEEAASEGLETTSKPRRGRGKRARQEPAPIA